jgi:hypothetical protein
MLQFDDDVSKVVDEDEIMDGIAFDGKCTCFLGIESFSCFQNLSNFLESDSPGHSIYVILFMIDFKFLSIFRCDISSKITGIILCFILSISC